MASGKLAAIRITKKRAQHVNLRDSSGTEAGTASAPLRVDPVGTTAQVVTASPITLTDRSGTVATGGTAQTVMAVNAARSYLFLQNVSSADLWFNFTTAAVQNQPSVLLPPVASFSMEGTGVSSELISIIGATTGQAYTAKETGAMVVGQKGYQGMFAFWMGGGGA